MSPSLRPFLYDFSFTHSCGHCHWLEWGLPIATLADGQAAAVRDLLEVLVEMDVCRGLVPLRDQVDESPKEHAQGFA